MVVIEYMEYILDHIGKAARWHGELTGAPCYRYASLRTPNAAQQAPSQVVAWAFRGQKSLLRRSMLSASLTSGAAASRRSWRSSSTSFSKASILSAASALSRRKS